MQLPDLKGVRIASENLKDVSIVTPLTLNERLSEEFNSRIFLKREDLQKVRSFKIRGAFNKIKSVDFNNSKNKRIICSSAGNHAQGFAFSCNKLKIHGTVYMPETTPKQKVERVKMFGGDFIKIILSGDNFDDAQKEAQKNLSDDTIFIHPFDDIKVIEGQGTVALEILDQIDKHFDYLIVPIGGGGLISGIITVFKELSPKTKIIGVEAEGAPAMSQSIQQSKIIRLNKIDNFVDGAAVKRVVEILFNLCNKYLDDIVLTDEGEICQTILDLYNKDAIVVEPAGAMAISALSQYKKKIKNKKVGCIICGSNNDIARMSEIKERAMLWSNLKHYFILKFPQRAGALKEFVNEVLGSNHDITYFQYMKKHQMGNGTATVGIELKNETDLQPLIERMKSFGFYQDYLNNKPELFHFLI